MSGLMKQWDGVLWQAAGCGELKRMREAIERGADVNIVSSGIAAIHHAAGGGWLEACQLLLDAGADVSPPGAADLGGSLHCIIESRRSLRLDILRFFLERGADPNQARLLSRKTPLHLAARIRDEAAVEAIQMLADFGAKPNVPDHSCLMPLHLAAGPAEWNLRNVRRLVAIGADPDYRIDGHVGYTPFQSTIHAGWRALAEFYIEECGQSLDQVACDGRTMLELASRSEATLQAYLSILTLRAVSSSIDDTPADRAAAGSRKPGSAPL